MRAIDTADGRLDVLISLAVEISLDGNFDGSGEGSREWYVVEDTREVWLVWWRSGLSAGSGGGVMLRCF